MMIWIPGIGSLSGPGDIVASEPCGWRWQGLHGVGGQVRLGVELLVLLLVNANHLAGVTFDPEKYITVRKQFIVIFEHTALQILLWPWGKCKDNSRKLYAQGGYCSIDKILLHITFHGSWFLLSPRIGQSWWPQTENFPEASFSLFSTTL